MANPALLEIKNLSIVITPRFNQPVVNKLSLSIEPGQCVGLVGESGSGKSLTALSTLQLLPINAAVCSDSQILFHGRDILQYSEQNMRRVRGGHIGIIFQDAMSAFNPVLTIGQQLMEVLRCHRHLSRSQNYAVGLDLLMEVGLDQPERCWRAYPHELSGGMRQRAMIAMALAGEPELLIADEPTTALDVTLQAQILALLKQLQQQRQMALLFISHHLVVVAQLADQVVVLRHGAMIETAPAKQFFIRPQQAYSRELLQAALPTQHYLSPLPAAQTLLQVEGLSVYFSAHSGWLKKKMALVKAVDNINFVIAEAETLALIGESGCGKTTAAKALLRLVPFNSGKISYAGQDLATLSARQMRMLRAKFQIIFQDPFAALNPRLFIADSIMEGMLTQRVVTSRQQALMRVDELLTQVELTPALKWRYPHEFSGGERQRICIARALALQPHLLILDEPTSALDLTIQKQILDLLRDLQQRLGLSYLLITHDMSVVAYMAHRVAVMHQGCIIEQNSVQNVLQHPQHAYTQQLLAAVPSW